MEDRKIFVIINDVKVLNTQCTFSLFEVHVETITGLNRIIICNDYADFYWFLIGWYNYLDYDFSSFGYLNEFGVEISENDLKDKFIE